jgi:hypothetical protein
MAVDLRAYVVNKFTAAFSNRIEREAATQIKLTTRRMAIDFVREAQIYPPQNAGNKPPAPYWERGKGLRRRDGSTNPPSQKLDESWTINSPFGGTAQVDNPVTYAPFVHDGFKQASFHKQRGWRNVVQIGDAIGLEIKQLGTGRYEVSRANSYLQQAADKIGMVLRTMMAS